MGVKRGFRHRCSRKKTKFTGKKRNPYMISLFLWLSFKNLKRWFSYRNDKISEVFLRWFSFSEMLIFQKIQAMFFIFRWPQFLCLKNSLFNDKENDTLSVMIRGKSPCFRNEGAVLVISKRSIIPKRWWTNHFKMLGINLKQIKNKSICVFKWWAYSFSNDENLKNCSY